MNVCNHYVLSNYVIFVVKNIYYKKIKAKSKTIYTIMK